MHIEKKSLVSKRAAAATIIAINSRRVDLSRPAPVRVELCKASGEKRGKYM